MEAKLAFSDPEYINYVENYQFWANDLQHALPQIDCAKIAKDFLKRPENGRRKKVAVLGYDGARADLLVNILASQEVEQPADDSSYVSGHAPIGYCSGIDSLIRDGGQVYLSYAGGEKATATEQPTETAAGWSSISSGVWHDKHEVTDNSDIKAKQAPSFMLWAAQNLGLRAAFIASWSGYFDNVFVNEMAAVKAQPAVNMIYRQCADDLGTYHAMSEAIQSDIDIVFCTFEATDWNGHSTGFSNKNYRYVSGFRDEDELAYSLIEQIKARPTYENEDWLIILTTDHGGLGTKHGGQSVEERTTWLACNKVIGPRFLTGSK